MEQQHKESLFFNYSDIFFSYYFKDDTTCAKMQLTHSLTYVYSGEMIIDYMGEKTVIGKDECAFIRRDVRTVMTKQAKDGASYKGIFLMFKRNFLRNFYQQLEKKGIPKESDKITQSVVKLPHTPEITSLFQSMTPYFDPSVKPRDEFMQLKLQEGVYALLNIDNRFYSTLFDFTEPWKIDILDFLNENYMYDLTMEDIATFTGRSLATLKRDFKKVSHLPPQKWLIRKRLEAAHEKIKFENQKVKDVYVDVGFKNLSHFSKAYKEVYGYAPTK
ncbi:MAG: AraC family transcriptional regulator [Bacteroidales bacterium]|jgi:AraC-like DNA-binding protein|nr:AraC family transcriptional regulator [Bacteroidales bacterium]